MRALGVFVLAGVLLGSVTVAAPDPAAQAVTLYGAVTDAETGEPVEMASVLLEGERVLAQTNAEGGFVLEAEEGVGPVRLTLRHPCYLTVRVEMGRETRDGTRRVEVGLPYDHEKYIGVARPLGGCEQR